MTLAISFTKKPFVKDADTAVVGVCVDNKLSDEAETLDKQLGGVISAFLARQKKFTGKKNQLLSVTLPADAPYIRVLVYGCGKDDELKPLDFEKLGEKLMGAYGSSGTETSVLFCDNAEAAASIALGVKSKTYKYEKFKTKKEDEPEIDLQKLEIVCAKAPEALKIYDRYVCAEEGVMLAKDLINEPANHLYPESYAERIKDELKPLGIEVEIIDDKKMKKLGFHAHLAVGQGAAYPPRVVVMRWNGGKAKEAPVGLVGKGVTFDTGGLNLKPTGSIENMKCDMGGSATVVGVMKTLALRKAKVNAVGVVGLVENAISDRSYKPSDIINSMAGKTIEVLNTDAEGRLVLIDSLTYIQRTYKPQFVVNLATLTGAIIVALSPEFCGVFANDDELWGRLNAASEKTGEKLWRMPLHEVFRKDVENPIADLQNMGKMGRWGGACTAASFLEHFIEEGTKWAHMDIAGVAIKTMGKTFAPQQANGFGIKLLDRMIEEHYE